MPEGGDCRIPWEYPYEGEIFCGCCQVWKTVDKMRGDRCYTCRLVIAADFRPCPNPVAAKAELKRILEGVPAPSDEG